MRRRSKKEELPASIRKKSSWKIKLIAAAAVAAIAVGSGGTIFLRYQSSMAMERPEGTTSSVTEVTAQLGNISNTIVGTGNLEADTPVETQIPSGITVSKVYVESGDQVSEGDVLAEVDSVSVLTAIEETQEQIQEIDSQINELLDDTQEEEITATVGGRVKRIFIEEDGYIAQCMLENGALMLLSIDGKMAVDLEDTTAETAKEDTVTVTLSDGTQVEGTVEETDGTSCTITMTDSGVGMDDTAVVTNEQGVELGTGTVYIHQQLEVTGSMGTVTEIQVAEDEAVESDETLLTLASSEETAEYQSLLASHTALANRLTELLVLSQDGYIKADMDGTVEEVYVSGESVEEDNAVSASQSIAASSMSYSQSSKNLNSSQNSGYAAAVMYDKENSGESFSTVPTVLRTSSMDQEASLSSEEENSQAFNDGESEEGNPVSAASWQEAAAYTEDETASIVLYLTVANSADSNAQTLGILSPVTGNTPQQQIVSADGSYTGTITWTPEDSVFAAASTYQASVVLYAAEGYCFAADSISSDGQGVLSGITLLEDGMSLSFQITFPQTAGENDSAEEEPESGENQNEDMEDLLTDGTSDGQENEGDGNLSGNGVNGTGENVSGNSQNTNSAGSGGTAFTQSSGQQSAASGTVQTTASGQAETAETGESASQTADSELNSYTSVFSISGDEEMILTINVDELDINSVSEGQEAQVTFDAIEEGIFQGNVTKVGNTASASGGVARYSVEITIPKDEEMKAGMNASATIVIENRENVVTIPVDALQERGNEVYVYTQQDEEGNLTGEQQVTTGLSDGETVEITEGLKEGDTVYYERIGSSSGSSGESGFGAGNGEMPGGGEMFKGGEMPGGESFEGGQMPSGDFGGGQGMGAMPER